jgi:hypothetical protein
MSQAKQVLIMAMLLAMSIWQSHGEGQHRLTRCGWALDAEMSFGQGLIRVMMSEVEEEEERMRGEDKGKGGEEGKRGREGVITNGRPIVSMSST